MASYTRSGTRRKSHYDDSTAAWNANLSFLMHHVVRTTGDPMEVREAVRDELRRIEMLDGNARIALDGNTCEVDPEGWLLRAR